MPYRGVIQVLIIEGNPDDALVACQVLRSFGLSFAWHRVDTETDLRQAIAERDWDIALCNQPIPQLDVTRVMAVLNGSAIPVVIITGTVSEAVYAQVMWSGIVDVVLKDHLADRLGPVVEREVTNARLRGELRRRRTDAVLKAFASTDNWQEAAQESLHQLARSFGAELAFMSEVIGTERRMHQVTSWSSSAYTDIAAWLGAQAPLAKDSLAGQAMLREQGVILKDLNDYTQLSRFTVALLEAGLRSQVSQPIQAGGRTFIVTLYFANPRADFDDMLVELAHISAALQPLLLRKIDYAELTLLRRALDCARNGVLITEADQLDPPGPRIIYANHAICKMSGYTPEMLLGQTPRVLQGPLTDPAALSRIRRALKAAEPITEELQNHRRDGTPYWAELNITPVFEQERLTSFIAIQTDITQRKADERERQEREASFRLLFQSNPMPMWVCDAETLAFVEVNDAAVSRYGWSREQFLQQSVHTVNPDAERNQAILAVAPLDRPNIMVSARHVTASGEAMAVQAAFHVMTWQGRAAYLAVVWDVTEMERARDELSRKNDMLAELTETLTARTADLVDAARLAGMGTWSQEFEPHCVVWSPEVYAIFGRDPQSFLLSEESILSCIHPDDAAGFRQAHRRIRKTGTDHQMEFRICRPSGEIRVLRELARPKRDAQGRFTGIAGVVQDITDQKMSADALLRAEKLKTIGQITGGIAHDFNNLLTVVSLNLEELLESPDTSALQRHLLELALHAARRSAELTAQMLSYARRQSLRPVETDLCAVVDARRPLLMRVVGDRHLLQITHPDQQLLVSIDPGQFENALMNLTINARDALTETSRQDGMGQIEIELEAVHVHGVLATQPDPIPPGSYVRVRVTDNGAGIRPDVMSRILEPFFTTKPLGTGSGLGLSMVYGFVRQSQGWLDIESTPGLGSRIDLYFPWIDETQRATAGQTVAPQTRKLHGHVLLVEDRTDVREAMQRLVRKIGFQVEAVSSGEMALERLRSPEHVDLLFTDILLPGGIDGPTLAEAATVLRPGLKVLLTSGDALQVTESRLLWPVIPKPFNVSALLEVLGSETFEPLWR